MGCELDRRCAKQVVERQIEIERVDAALIRLRAMCMRNMSYSSSLRISNIDIYRDRLVVELYDLQRSYAAYDQRRAWAQEDPTGQDLDAFYESYGERDEPKGWEE